MQPVRHCSVWLPWRNVSSRCVGPAVRATLLWALLFAPALAAVAADEPSAVVEAVIPAGQEDLLAEMLGRGVSLADCKLAAGDVDHAIIKATYTCPGGEVVFELRHPSKAPADATRTARFAIMLVSGSPPPGLADALTSRIRSHESAFEWTLLGPHRFPLVPVLVAAAGVLGIAILGWALWRQRSAQPTQLP